MKYYKKDGSEIEFTTIMEDSQKASVFRHFKGESNYRIITIAKHSETLEDMVIYTHDNTIWARPIEMFFGPVDKSKYPDVKQEMRFQKIK